jgi:hypothetical protein
VDVQKRAASSVLQSAFTPDRQAAVAAVSEEALCKNQNGYACDGELLRFPVNDTGNRKEVNEPYAQKTSQL